MNKKASGEGEFRVSIDEGEWVYTGTFEAGKIVNGRIEDYPCTILFDANEYLGTYTGEILDGFIEGNGVFVVSLEEDVVFSYDGKWMKGGLPAYEGYFENYPCIFSYQDLDIMGYYTGDILNNKFNGQGEFRSDSDINFNYLGSWKDNVPSGIGILDTDQYQYTEGIIGTYEGDVLEGIPNGNGVFTYQNSDNVGFTYTGEWKNGLFNGKGFFDSYNENVLADYRGTFTNGKYTPTRSEFIMHLSSFEMCPYEVSDISVEFIDMHEDFFPAEDLSIIEEYVDEDIKYNMITKFPHKYGDKFIRLEGYTVNTIRELEFPALDDNLTLIIAYTGFVKDNVYIYYIGSLEDIYRDDKITIYGLPIDAGGYVNAIGGKTNCIVLYGSYIQKENH